MSDTPTLVRFYSGWIRDGNGPDGLPLFRETVRVQMDRPPYLRIEREAEEEDFIDHPGPHELYKKTCEARKTIVGYPLASTPSSSWRNWSQTSAVPKPLRPSRPTSSNWLTARSK